MLKSTFDRIAAEMAKSGCSLYDEVASNLHNLTKEDVKEILSEVIWIATSRLSEEDYKAFEDEVMESILENQVLEDD